MSTHVFIVDCFLYSNFLETKRQTVCNSIWNKYYESQYVELKWKQEREYQYPKTYTQYLSDLLQKETSTTYVCKQFQFWSKH